MKKNYIFSALVGLLSLGMTAQETVVTDPTADAFIGYANVFNTAADGGDFVFGQGWGVPDLQTIVDAGAGTITLQPNFNTYDPADEFWSNGDIGNKIFEGNTYLEDNSLIGSEVTFTGGVSANTLDPAYVAVAFIKVFNSDFSVLKEETTPLVDGQEFTVTYTNVEAEDTTLQYGWYVRGLNANPTQEADLGSIVLVSTVLSVNEVNDASVSIYPNPSSDVWNVTANTPIQSIEIVNLLGQRVSFETPNATNVAIANSHLSTGVYTATVVTEEGSKTTKLVRK
jgi:hypothetical protein